MKIQPPPGMRDFYPDDMRLQNWLFEHWRQASLAFGFQEYEGPIFEFLELYTVKSGAGIVSELFNFQDRGERRFAIRPEMTPTLARMVAARANALPRPIKWFSLPRMCRAEKPQRGRLREFFQWNADILGVDDVLADAEVIAVACEFARRVGLGPEDVALSISSRRLAEGVLTAAGLRCEQIGPAFQLLDKFEKLPEAEFDRQWHEAFPALPVERLRDLLQTASRERCTELAAAAGAEFAAAAVTLNELWQRLTDLGVAEYCAFDLKTVRGLAYYTGVVFELHARGGGLRALMGGGRYDNLCELLDGPSVPGVGFGMGDAPMLEALKELGKLPTLGASLDAFVIDADEASYADALRIVGTLRQANLSVDFSYKRQALGKQLKQATARNARFAVIVGSEYRERGEVGLKNLATGEQVSKAAGVLVASIKR